MFKWFDATAVEKFGGELGDFFVTNYPAIKTHKNPAKKQEELFNQMLSSIAAFKQRESLNVYKKAKLSNTFKWRLLDAGFDSKLVSEVTLFIVSRL